MLFQWDHPNEPTPSLTQMVEAAAKYEPGANKKLVFVKNVGTRFGMSRTSGLALVYDSEAHASIEPEYVSERHKSLDQPAEEIEQTPEMPSEEVAEESDEEDGEG